MSSAWCRGVELGDEFAVCGAGGGQILVAFLELQAQFDGLLFEVADLLVEGVDVGGDAEARFVPGLFTECFGQAGFQLPDTAGEPQGAIAGGEQVDLQRGPGDRRGEPVAGGGRGGLEGVDLREQVAVAVEEAAVDPGGAGDLGDADLGPVGAGAVECGDDAVAPAGRIGLPAWHHRGGSAVGVVGGGSVAGHAVASGTMSGVMPRMAGMPRDTPRCRRMTVTASSIAARSVSLAWSRSPSMRVMSARIRVISCWLGVASARSPPPTDAAPSRWRNGRVRSSADLRPRARSGCRAGRNSSRSPCPRRRGAGLRRPGSSRG